MTAEQTTEVSPLDTLIDSVASEVSQNGTSVRDLSTTDVEVLAQAAIAERGASEKVRGVSVAIREEGSEPLLHADLQLSGGIRGVDLENAKSDRRGQEEDPTASRIRVKGIAQRTAAGILLHGDLNDIFADEVAKRLTPKGVNVQAVGLHITPNSLRVAVRG